MWTANRASVLDWHRCPYAAGADVRRNHNRVAAVRAACAVEAASSGGLGP